MKRHPFLTGCFIALMLLQGLGNVVKAAPVTAPLGSALTTERRIVDMVAPGTLFPRTEQYEFGFGPDLHVPGLDCNLGPAELNLDYLTFERTDDGYLGTIIFFSAIEPLSELNGNPVTLSIRLILTPPEGDAIVIRQSLTSGKLTVKRGKETLDLGKNAPIAKLDGDRLLLSVPDSIGVKPDWSVAAQVDIEGKEPICPYVKNTRISSETPPVTVGSLSGEQQDGAITFTPLESGTSSDGQTMPAGSKIKSLTMEQNADGTLVVVATMDGDVLALQKTHSEAFTSLNIALDLASPGFFGMDYPYELHWFFPMNGGPEPVARIADPHLGIAIYLGEVPVTVDGDQVRFDFGKFKAYPPDTSGLTYYLPAPFGDYGSLFFGEVPHSDPICLCEGGPALPSDVVLDPDEDVLAYEIIGNLISITHMKSGETAYGWIDYDGRFLAENDDERYKGLIKLFPLGDSYEVGVQASYLRKIGDAEESTLTLRSQAIQLQTGEATALTANLSSNRLLYEFDPSSNVYNDDMVALFEAVLVFNRFSDTDIEDCQFFKKRGQFPNEDLVYRCSMLFNAIDTMHFIVAQHSDDPDFKREYQDLLARSEGMANPPADVDNISNQNGYAPVATPVASGIPFPLPFSQVTPYQPAGVNPDWALRAGSFWSYTNDVGGVILSVTSPFVDSHLLLAVDLPADSAMQVSPITGIHEAVLPGRRLHRSGRGRRTRN